MVKKSICLLLCLFLFFQQTGFAQVAAQLDISGYFSQMGAAMAQEKFRPVHLRYLAYDNLKNNFNLLLDKGDAKTLQDLELKESARRLLDYFLIGVSLPNDSFWVNLRPDSDIDIIDEMLARTDLGRVMLEADVLLKKDAALATSPRTKEGKQYWNRLYKKAGELFGTEDVTIPTITRPWIVPDEIIIRETRGSAYVYKATLKVMLEQDYLKGSAVYDFKDERSRQLNDYAAELMRELIIPKLNREINTSKRYAPLRQVFYSLIIAQWFKQRFRTKGGEYAWRIDNRDLSGLTSAQPWSKEEYFRQYQQSFKEGEYNINEPVNSGFGQSIRNYFSGGINLMEVGSAIAPATLASGAITSTALAEGGEVVLIGGREGVVPRSADASAGVEVLPDGTVRVSSSAIGATEEAAVADRDSLARQISSLTGGMVSLERALALRNELDITQQALSEAGVPQLRNALLTQQLADSIRNNYPGLSIQAGQEAARSVMEFLGEAPAGYVYLGQDQTIRTESGISIDANPTSFKNKNAQVAQIVFPQFGLPYDAADIQFVYFGNVFFRGKGALRLEPQEQSLLDAVLQKKEGFEELRPQAESMLRSKGFYLVEPFPGAFVVSRPSYMVVKNAQEYERVKTILDVAFRDNPFLLAILKKMSEAIGSVDKGSPYNIINLEEAGSFSVATASGAEVNVEVDYDRAGDQFVLRDGTGSGYVIAPRQADVSAAEHVYETGDFSQEQLEEYSGRPQDKLSVTYLGIGDALSKGDVTNFIVNVGRKGVLADASLEAYNNLKGKGFFNSDNIGYVLLTHNHADHNAGTVQMVLDNYFSANRNVIAARERIRSLNLVMPQDVKNDLVQIVAAILPGGISQQQRQDTAAELLSGVRVPQSITDEAGNEELVFRDIESGIEISFYRHNHPIPTYGFVIASGYGSAGYVVDTQDMKDFNRIAQKLETLGDNRAVLITENGVPGIHLTGAQIDQATEASPFLMSLAQSGQVRSVHSAAEGDPGKFVKAAVRFGTQVVNSEVSPQEDVGEAGNFPAASSAITQEENDELGFFQDLNLVFPDVGGRFRVLNNWFPGFSVTSMVNMRSEPMSAQDALRRARELFRGYDRGRVSQSLRQLNLSQVKSFGTLFRFIEAWEEEVRVFRGTLGRTYSAQELIDIIRSVREGRALPNEVTRGQNTPLEGLRDKVVELASAESERSSKVEFTRSRFLNRETVSMNYEKPIKITLAPNTAGEADLYIYRFSDIPDSWAVKSMINPNIPFYILKDQGANGQFKAMRNQEEVMLGRQNQGRFLGLDADTISRMHVQITCQGDKVFITDRSTAVPAQDNGLGGIDFGSMNIIIQGYGSEALSFKADILSPAPGDIDLKEEWRDIRSMVESGIVPSTARIREYMQYSCLKDSLKQEAGKILNCLADILRLEEERLIATDPAIEDMLALLESNKATAEMQQALIEMPAISVQPALRPGY